MKRLDDGTGRGFSYSDDVSALEEYYEKQYKMIKAGNTDLATLELVMLGNTLDFIHFARQSFGIVLDGSEKSVAVFDEVLDALSRGIVQENLFSHDGSDIAGNAAAYLGFVVIANVGGEWEDTENGTAVSVNGRTAYISEFVARRLMSGSKLNAEDYYKSIKIVKE
ncbi:MAG: hypothetical protein II711_01245 [Clostridia bacterium]|nr:hypothetical protein [Clostridia bacterium]